jgi:peptidoglycan LD-endopeptidase CwlK
VDSDPEKGNILDFAYDIFIDSALAHGYVENVTAQVAGGLPLTTVRTRWTARRRTSEYDTSKRLIVPKLHNNEVVAADMISRATFKRMDRSAIKTGDVLLFSRVDPAKPVGDTLMVGHLAVAVNIDGEIYMMHATRDYAWRPDATKDSKPIAAGVYYLDDPRREQLGVSNAGEWVEDKAGRQVKIDGKPYYGYNPAKLRPVHDYIVGAHIQGIMVLRPVDGAAPPQAAPAKAAPAAAAVVDVVDVVDSKLTLEQAIKEHLAPGCPPAIAARQRVVDVTYTSLDGKLHQGQIVVDERVEADVSEVFALIRDTKFPVRSVIPISDPAFLTDGRWDDNKSTAANNTSAFNYRAMTGSKKLSMHACGLALDLNPALNPYIKGKKVEPPGAVYDPSVPGTLTADHPITRKFKALGWRWGGDFTTLKDYQHFEKLACP